MSVLNLIMRIRFLVIAVLMVISGCTNRKPVQENDEMLVSLFDVDLNSGELDEPTHTWHVSDECICVVYGYGYNDSEFVQSMNNELFRQYGSYEDGGAIYPLVFPGDFKRGTKHYISLLSEYLGSRNVKGIIILGTPEGTCSALGRMQDSYGGQLPYPVISLFSQDDVLGMEYSSDFVLDKSLKAEINGIIAEEDSENFVENVPEILKTCVKYVSISDAPFEKNARLLEIVKKVTGQSETGRYSDPDTGLYSINHFVLE